MDGPAKRSRKRKHPSQELWNSTTRLPKPTSLSPTLRVSTITSGPPRREFRRGIELNPNSADGHFLYPDFLISLKRVDEWNTEIHRTLNLDPFNPFFQCFYGWQLIYVQRYD